MINPGLSPDSSSKLETEPAVVPAENLSTVVRDHISNGPLRGHTHTHHACALLQNPSKMRSTPGCGLPIADSWRWRIVEQRTRTTHSSSSRSVCFPHCIHYYFQGCMGLTNVVAAQDRADELHGKHTLFGKVVGDTLYSTSSVCCS